MGKLRPSGGYRDLCSFQTSTLIYDGTYFFCDVFLDPRSRTVDQMIQAARSGRQNIAEGSRAAATSSQTELRLLNVARASLEELLLDFEDFLRHRRLEQWAPDSAEAKAVRQVPQKFRKDRSDQSDLTDLTDQERWALYARWLEHKDPAVRANALICLSIRPTSCSISRLPRAKSSLLRKAVTANNWLLPAWPNGAGNAKHRSQPIRQASSLPAPDVINL